MCVSASCHSVLCSLLPLLFPWLFLYRYVSTSLSPVLCLLLRFLFPWLFLYHCESALHFLLRRKEGAEQDRVFLGHSDGVMMESSESVLWAGL